jgi:hypothetical protein
MGHLSENHVRSVQIGILLCLLTAARATADEEFAPAVRIEASGMPIDVGGFRGAALYVGDIDEDGLNDLLVGEEELGRLRIYRNAGTKEEPRFGDFEWFQVNGEIAELPGYGQLRPQLVDLNGDEERDLVTSSRAGMVFWYRRTADGKFMEAETLRRDDGQLLNVGTDAACHVTDWDGDGDNDLIVDGRLTPDARTGEVRLIENKGSRRALSLAPPRPLEAEGQPIHTPQRESCPVVADWNRDGKWDLLLGAPDGSILLYENTGIRNAPRLAKGRQLVSPIQPQRQADDDELRRGRGGNFCVTDWNNDGRLDILIADAQLETIRPAVPEAAEQLEKIRQESVPLLGDYRRLRGLYNRLSPETQAQQREVVRQSREQIAVKLQELRIKASDLEKAMRPQHKQHGYVWLLESTNAP